MAVKEKTVSKTIIDEWREAYFDVDATDVEKKFRIKRNENGYDLIVSVRDPLVRKGASRTVVWSLLEASGKFKPFWIRPGSKGWLVIEYMVEDGK